MRIRFRTAAGLVLIAVSATACSGGSSSGSPSSKSGTGGSASASAISQAGPAATSSIDVCSLMTAKRASSITGVTYSKAASSKDQCTYATTDAPVGMFIIIFPNSGGTVAWKEEVATLEEDGSGQPLVTIHGFSGPAAGDADEMGVQVGSDIIDVHSADPNGTGAAFPESTAIAKAIASQLH